MLLATLPVVGVFVTGGPAVEHRLLLAIPFWIILMSFTFAALLKLRPWPGVQIVFGALTGLILLDGLGPLDSIHLWQDEKSRFRSTTMRNIRSLCPGS